MKLLFLYVEEYRSLKKVCLNFDSNLRFSFDRKKLICEYSEVLPPNFFSIEEGGQGRVECVSALIGENGAGKTSIAALMNRIFAEGEESEIKYIYILEEGRGDGQHCATISCCSNIYFDDLYTRDLIEKLGWSWRRGPGKSSFPFSLIYYSPYYHAQPIFDDNYSTFEDLSVSAQLQKYTGSSFGSDQFKKIIDFITTHAHILSRWKEFPSPSIIEVSPNYDFVVGTYKRCKSNFNTQFDENILLDLEKLYSKFMEKQVSSVSDWEFKFQKGHLNIFGYLSDALDIGFVKDIVLDVYAGFLSARIKDCFDWKQQTGIERRAFGPVCSLFLLALPALSVRNQILKQVSGNGGNQLSQEDLIVEWQTLTPKKKSQFRTELIKKLTQVIVFGLNDINDSLVCCLSSFDSLVVSQYKHLVILMKKMKRLVESRQLRDNDSHSANSYSVGFCVLDNGQRRTLYSLLSAYSECQIGQAPSFLKFKFKGVSSGEFAFLSLFASLDARMGKFRVKRSAKDKLDKVILFLDEVETAMHPSWQRDLVYVIIRYIETCVSEASHVHVIVASHSPVLLSDIPKGNVCFLCKSDGKRRKLKSLERLMNTFSANIFDLYSLSFFLKDGTIGSFAMRKLNKVLSRIMSNHGGPLTTDEEKVIELIGDSRLRMYFRDMKNSHNGTSL